MGTTSTFVFNAYLTNQILALMCLNLRVSHCINLPQSDSSYHFAHFKGDKHE